MSYDIIRKLVREEIRRSLKEFGAGMPYFNPQGFEQLRHNAEGRNQRFDNLEKWKTTAMQLGATIVDRGDDWSAVLPNKKVLGTFSKMNYFGFLLLIK